MSRMSCLPWRSVSSGSELKNLMSYEDAKSQHRSLRELTLLDVMANQVEKQGLWDGDPRLIAATMLEDQHYSQAR